MLNLTRLPQRLEARLALADTAGSCAHLVLTQANQEQLLGLLQAATPTLRASSTLDCAREGQEKRGLLDGAPTLKALAASACLPNSTQEPDVQGEGNGNKPDGGR